jgi:hypothetical protein
MNTKDLKKEKKPKRPHKQPKALEPHEIAGKLTGEQGEEFLLRPMKAAGIPTKAERRNCALPDSVVRALPNKSSDWPEEWPSSPHPTSPSPAVRQT